MSLPVLPTSFALRVCGAASLLVLAACGKAPEAPPPPPPPAVALLQVAPTMVPKTVQISGQSEGVRQVEVRARVGGILTKRLYQEGEQVSANQVLFQIDPVPFELELARAKAQLAEQQARLEQATREERRLKDMAAQKAVSQKEADDALTTRLSLQATVEGSAAAVKQAELNLGYTRVTAPIAGVSGRAERSEGTLVNTSTDSLLTTVVQTSPIWVRFSLSDQEIAGLRDKAGGLSKAQVSLTLANGKKLDLKGRINFEAGQVDPRLSTVQLRAEFDNPKTELLPGQFVRVGLTVGTREAVLLPQTAVLQNDQGRFVYVLGEENKAQVRPVQTDGWQGNQWVVVGGLKAGEKVIADNLLRVRPGSPVKPIEAGAGASAGGTLGAPGAPGSAPAGAPAPAAPAAAK